MNDEVKTFDAVLFRQVFRQVWIIVGIILLSRFTRNFAVVGAAETAMQAPPSTLLPLTGEDAEIGVDDDAQLAQNDRGGEP